MFKQIILTFGVRICTAVLNFLVIVLLSQGLGPDGKGICTRYIAIISNALIFCDLIGGPAIVFFAAKSKIKNILPACYTWSAITSTLVIFIFYFFGKLNSDEVLHLIILSIINSCIAIHQNLLSGKMQFGKVNLLIFLQALLTFVCLKIQFSDSNAFPGEYIFSLYIAWGLTAILGFIFVIVHNDDLQKTSVLNFLKFAVKFGIVNQVGHILQFFNQRLSYFLLGEAPLGVFSNASSVGESVWMVSNSIATVQYGKISNTENKQKAEKISLVLLKLNLAITILATIVLMILPDSFFTWVFGKEFAGIHTALIYLGPGLICFSGYLIIGHHYSGRGAFAINIIPISIGLLFTVFGLIYIFSTKTTFTIYHAAILTSVSYFGNFITASLIFKKMAHLKILDFLPSKTDIIFIKQELINNTK